MRGAFDLGEVVIERTLSNPQILRGFNDGMGRGSFFRTC